MVALTHAHQHHGAEKRAGWRLNKPAAHLNRGVYLERRAVAAIMRMWREIAFSIVIASVKSCFRYRRGIYVGVNDSVY